MEHVAAQVEEYLQRIPTNENQALNIRVYKN